MERITEKEFSEIIGAPADLSGTELGYRLATAEERDEFILTALKRIFDPNLGQREAAENLKAFDRGWGENLSSAAKQGVSLETLKPKYVKPYRTLRYRGQVIVPTDPLLLDRLYSAYAKALFLKYFSDKNSIYEFGCGSARYLFELAGLFPQKKVHGLDWAQSAVDILKLVKKAGYNFEGAVFDMLHPDNNFRLDPGAGVYTMGALEQLGDGHEQFIDYLIAQKPAVVLNFEPLADLYDETKLLDFLAIRYHKHRGYLHGYISALRRREAEGRLQILDLRRFPVGTPDHESASLVAWTPTEYK